MRPTSSSGWITFFLKSIRLIYVHIIAKGQYYKIAGTTTIKRDYLRNVRKCRWCVRMSLMWFGSAIISRETYTIWAHMKVLIYTTLVCMIRCQNAYCCAMHCAMYYIGLAKLIITIIYLVILHTAINRYT